MTRTSVVAVIGAALLIGGLLRAADGEEGFVPLFNGKDMTGWAYGKGGKAGQGYQVREGGIIYCTAKDGGQLRSEKEYGDFVLRFDFKLTANANNGIAIRTPIDGDAAYVGMEIQVLDDSGSEYKTLRPSQYHGSIYDLVPAKRGHQKPVGEWNTEEITAKGSRITVRLNGETIVDADLSEIKDEAVLKKHPGIKREKGHVGFCGHGKEVEFRNVRIKEL
jgi:hypothetical protein